ncbi:unnamed protein product [Hyaloperonospora brassicae]|uniref:RWP-RK domain-containing protein n=1 Tax=Hyaloperonospora brassicae TaxID=162125 RepID=A0AAV0T088_HYABA|nr:unnamed protein product [Hyaloperonospora brassicae]
MATRRILEKEIEASVSLLYMRRPCDTVVDTAATKGPRAGAAKDRDALHESLMKVVAKQVPNELSLRQKLYVKKKCGARLTALSRELTLEELRPHFGQPIVEVAREFGICTTFLKKLCRQCGIKRWPHRQIRSLNRTIQMLEQVESKATSSEEKATYAAQIEELKDKQRAVMEDPDVTGGLKRMKKLGGGSKGTTAGHIPARADQDKELLPSMTMTRDGDDAKNLLALAVAVDSMSGHIESSEAGLLRAKSREGGRLSPPSLGVHIPSSNLSTVPVPSSLMTPMQAALATSQCLKSLRMSPTHRIATAENRCDAKSQFDSFSVASLQRKPFCMGKR